MHNPKQTNPPSNDGVAAAVKATGTGRRAFTRYPVNLNGIIADRDGKETPCQIKDFCLNGILLEYLPPMDGAYTPRAGDIISIHCSVPALKDEKKVTFKARVARATDDGAGLALINPDRDALQLMQQFALQFPADERRSQKHILRSSDSKSRSTNQLHAAATACAHVVEHTLENLLSQIFNKLTAQLFKMSRDTHDPAEQNDLFNASETIKKNASNIQNSFRAAVHIRLSNPIQSETMNQPQSDDLSLEDMSLIGDEDLGAWIAISEITGKIEEKNKEEILTLEERLSHLFGISVRSANNPYGPVLFVEPFQTALSQYSLSPKAATTCHTIFKEILISESPGFYNKLNAALIAHDILPELTYKTIRKAIQSKQNAKKQNDGHEELNNTIDRDQSTPGEYIAHANLADSQTKNDAPNPASSTPQQHSREINKLSEKSRASRESTPQNLYAVMQELRELKQSISQLNAVQNPTGINLQSTIPGAIPPNGGYHSSPEIMEVLSELQSGAHTATYHENDHIKFRILSGLAARNTDNELKYLNPQDNSTLDVVGDLLIAMQNDPLVADSVRPWLRKLELPIAKLALNDPTVFVDQSHIARQVVNKISQLEFYARDESSPGQNAIGAAIEQLLQRVILEQNNGPEIFNEILVKLNTLVKIQDQAYKDNLSDLIQACQSQPPSKSECDTIFHSNYLSDADIRKWILHAKRLKKGDYVLYRDAELPPIRLRIAWISNDLSVYVFVNSKGLKEKVLSLEDMARLIAKGALSPQTNANDPAMDRAQYAIMQDLYQQVLHESTHDSTTGLINRREFEIKLNAALASAKKDDMRHVLLFIDVDKFSAINSSCGYAGGDRLLKDLIAILENEMNQSHIIARLGSDEFGILMEDCTIDDALAIAEQKIESAGEYRLSWEDNIFSATLSIGLVPISARSDNVESLLQSAESSCNAAKDAGGNRLQLFHAGHARIAHRSEITKWIGKIDKMLENNDLEIRCQRIQSIGSSEAALPHYEILLGINDEHGRVSSPYEFITAMEWYGRMPSVDRWVIRRVLNWMAEHADVIEGVSGFAINLSGQSLNEEGFCEFIMEEFKRVKVPYEKICFEVTETVGINNLSDAALFIERIKEVGCRFSLDDFGSGMSSYGYLKDLPVDIVKIDGSFVKNLINNPCDFAVVKSITDIAHVMNKKVVAEYVETKEILDLLREIGVDYAQGYLIDKPGPLTRLLSSDYTPMNFE